MAVFVLDDRKNPLMPCSEKRARKLLEAGRVAVRATGSFNIQTAEGVVQGISHRHCTLIQRADGYGYSQRGAPAKASTAARSPLYLTGLKADVSRGN